MTFIIFVSLCNIPVVCHLSQLENISQMSYSQLQLNLAFFLSLMVRGTTYGIPLTSQAGLTNFRKVTLFNLLIAMS